MRLEELTTDLLRKQALDQALAAGRKKQKDKAISGKVTGPGWDRAVDGVCGPVQEQQLQDVVTPVEAQVVDDETTDEEDSELVEVFEESLDLLEDHLALLDNLIEIQLPGMPRQIRDSLIDKRLDLYDFLSDYRDLDGDAENASVIEKDREAVQDAAEFFEQLNQEADNASERDQS